MMLFDASGRFSKLIGREGQGPGEFRTIIGVMVGPGDSIYVFEAIPTHYTVLSPTHEYVRSSRIPVSARPHPVVVDQNGTLMMFALSPAKDLVGAPLHLLAGDGRSLGAFSAPARSFTIDSRSAFHRNISRSPTGEILVAHPAEYRIDVFGADGALHRTVRREAPWFQPWGGIAVEPPSVQPPRPAVMAAWMLGADRLLTMISTADLEWKAAGNTNDRVERAGDRIQVNAYRKQLDPIFEVLDLRTNTVLASRRVDGYFQPSATPGLVVLQRESAEGVPILDVWRAVLP